MSSLTDLREVVDVVIGVDTYVHTHSAAIVDARTGGVLDEITADGDDQLVEFADEHTALRPWAIEGTGGHGAGLTRHLERHEEVVIEHDRPERAKRRHGAKSDPRPPASPTPCPTRPDRCSSPTCPRRPGRWPDPRLSRVHGAGHR